MTTISSRPRRQAGSDGERDPRCWAVSVGIGAAFTLLAGLVYWFGAGAWFRLHAATYADLEQLTTAGRLVWHGHVQSVYHTVPTDALPLSFLVMAPLTPLYDRLPSMVPDIPRVLVAGSYILLAAGIPLLIAVRRLAWESGVRSRLWLLQVAAALLVLLPEYEYGHIEDVLALTCTLYAVRRLLRRDHLHAAALLGLATGFKQWSIMLLPLVIMSAPPGRKVRAAGAGSAIPAVLLAVSLGLDGRSGLHTLVLPEPSNRWSGHPGLEWVLFGTSAAELSRILAVAAAVALAWRFRSVTEADRVLVVCSTILVVRPLTELVDYAYYWSPALLVLAIAGTTADRHVRPAVLLLPTAALLWTVPQGYGSPAGGWWVCELTVLIGAGVLQARRMTTRGRAPAQATPLPAPG